jgi:hypothetical protein
MSIANGMAFEGVRSGDGEVDIVGPTTVAAVPEPASLVLLGLGGATLLGYGWRRRRQPKA